MLLPFAIIFITLALIFYTVGVFAERASGFLKKWHLIVFWLGLACDTTGTVLMSKLSGNSAVSFHSVTGLAAIVMMAVNAIWATVVMLCGSETSRKNFHKFIIIVWIIWLIPYISGMFLGMARG